MSLALAQHLQMHIGGDQASHRCVDITAGQRQGQLPVRVGFNSVDAPGENAEIESSNRMPLAKIPVGTQIYAIEIHLGKGAQLVRSAGARAQLMAKEGDYAQIRLPSGEVRRVRLEATAALGVVGNIQHQNVKIGSAGRKRRKGIRPTVRGVVMNAADHPHGGGDGGRHGTGKAPRTPWGQLTLGYRTRRRKDVAGNIVKSRHDAKRKK